MLEATLTNGFHPETNLTGGFAGGNCNLEREQVVKNGIPSVATMVASQVGCENDRVPAAVIPKVWP
jgi:hypothetical protein